MAADALAARERYLTRGIPKPRLASIAMNLIGVDFDRFG